MRYAIVGAGAMGSLFGGLLGRSGEDVWLIDSWLEQVEALKRNGLVLEDGTGALGGGEVAVKVQAASSADEVGPVDVVLFFVKSYSTAEAARASGALMGPSTVALTLQNGLGNVEALEAELGFGRVLAGSTTCGATFVSPGRVRFAGKGPTVVGELDGKRTDRALAIAKSLNRAGLEASVSDDIRATIWGKVLVNVGINALTALTGLRNGELLNYEETRLVMRSAVEEAVAVARARGISVPWADPVAHVVEVAKATATNRSSMLQDVDRGRRTEIEAINGQIVREARLAGLAAPVNEVLTALVRMKEKTAKGA